MKTRNKVRHFVTHCRLVLDTFLALFFRHDRVVFGFRPDGTDGVMEVHVPWLTVPVPEGQRLVGCCEHLEHGDHE